MDDKPIVITMELQDGYRFLVRFDQDGAAPLLMNEPAARQPRPLGGSGVAGSVNGLLADRGRGENG